MLTLSSLSISQGYSSFRSGSGSPQPFVRPL